MENIFTKWNGSPVGRLIRRFAIVGLSALIPYFISKVGLDPATIIDRIIAIPVNEWIFFLKLFLGASLVGGLDKLTREWKNIAK